MPIITVFEMIEIGETPKKIIELKTLSADPLDHFWKQKKNTKNLGQNNIGPN